MSEWQPIETAPKDGSRVLLYRPTCDHSAVVGGEWREDKYSKRPRPYWTHDREPIFGIADARANQPTHWMPRPEPPK